MEYLVTAEEMKRYDSNTVTHFMIPSEVLMERAALACAEAVRDRQESMERAARNAGIPLPGRRVLILCGTGNNGGDGFAAGRLLHQQGFDTDFYLAGGKWEPKKPDETGCSRETALQLRIVRQYGLTVMRNLPAVEYDIIIDALFGIGLSRPLDGIYAAAVRYMNVSEAFVLSVDIPSGIHADTGCVMGDAVKADMTVTFGFRKLGHVLYPGAEYCGSVICRDIGITVDSFLTKPPNVYTFTDELRRLIPARRPDGNKGTFGKVLLAAGSAGMAGAAVLAAGSVLRSGAGMVRVLTDIVNRQVLQTALPEAMVSVYDSGEEESDSRHSLKEEVQRLSLWADAAAIGPGMGTGRIALRMLRLFLNHTRMPLVIDADAINLLAMDRELLSALERSQNDPQTHRELIFTPHPGEFARLAGVSIQQVLENGRDLTGEWAQRLQAVFVCKSARTLVAGPGTGWYLNLTGNSGMAAAGSGDVLTGIAAGLLAQGMNAFDAARAAVCLHGMAGDAAADRLGEYGMTASDIVTEIGIQIKGPTGGRRFKAAAAEGEGIIYEKL